LNNDSKTLGITKRGKSMHKIITRLDVGAEKPFTLLHISDTHLTHADERDDERKLELAKARSEAFPNAEIFLSEVSAYANEINTTILHTGDLIDFVSYANLDFVKEFIDNNDCFMAAGNHEFSLYVGEAFEDAAYRNQSLARVQAVFKNDIRFSSRVIGGVNFVAIDNSYYRFEAEQLEALKRETKRGFPIVLAMHSPLHCEALYQYQLNKRKRECAFLTSTPLDLLEKYPEKRFIQQRADNITLETTEYIKAQPCIKALLTGHLHFDFDTLLTPTLPQLVTGKRTVRVVQIM
jgi:hypothetical protein